MKILSELDIFNEVGRGVAHDVIVEFTHLDGKIHVEGQSSSLDDGRLRLDFIKVTFFVAAVKCL